MTNALVRRAAIDDADAMFPIAVEFATSFTPERAPFGRALRELLDDAAACVLVAVIERRVCGYLLGFDHATFFANGRVAWVLRGWRRLRLRPRVAPFSLKEGHRRHTDGRVRAMGEIARSPARGSRHSARRGVLRTPRL